jgi:hypothetical protein
MSQQAVSGVVATAINPTDAIYQIASDAISSAVASKSLPLTKCKANSLQMPSLEQYSF